MVIGKLDTQSFYFPIADRTQDIAPTYYDVPSFPKGEVKTALQRVEDKIKRKKAMKGGR